MFERYVPQHYARDFVEVRGDSAQLVNFMATALGHKPLMDDWIAPDRLPALREVCARYGLAVEAESMFVMVDIRETGLSALIATHNMELAGRMDRVVRLG